MTIPILHGIDDRSENVEDPAQLDDFVNRRLLPFMRRAREIINESNTRTEAAHTGNYEWDLERFGTLFIEQTSGVCVISVDATVTLARLRQGRRYSLVFWNNSGAGLGPIAVSFSSDFDATSVLLVANGDTASWTFVVKDSAFGPTGTLMEV